jgi:hypothetical protein
MKVTTPSKHAVKCRADQSEGLRERRTSSLLGRAPVIGAPVGDVGYGITL